MTRIEKFIVFTIVAGFVVLMLAGRAVWPFGNGLEEGYAVVSDSEVRKLFPLVVSQIESASLSLQTLGIGLIVVIGLIYRAVLHVPKSFIRVEIVLLLIFVICELFSAYISYWLRIIAISELSLGYLNGNYLQSFLAYQAVAVMIAALCTFGVVLIVVVPNTVSRVKS